MHVAKAIETIIPKTDVANDQDGGEDAKITFFEINY